jgi:dihydroxyacetone kinase-like protein
MTIGRDAIVGWLTAYAGALAANKDYLTRLDSAIGDADHGINMDRGFQAVLAKLPALGDAGIAATLKSAGTTLVSTVGGASGPLYGTFFLQMASATTGKSELALCDWIAAFDAGVEGVIRRGKAAPGDKTMVDCLAPAVQALKAAAAEGAGWGTALRRAEEAGRHGMEATVPLVARKGRASYLGERSAGHQDPGATSSHLLLVAAVEALGAGD